MEGSGYQNGSAREADFQRLAQNTGTNIQKILQNGELRSVKILKIIVELAVGYFPGAKFS